MMRITVGQGSGDYYSIQEALDSVPYNTEAEIVIAEGVYNERIFSDKRSLTLRGEGEVCIKASCGAREILPYGRKRGTFRSYTAFFSGEHLRLDNLTVVNDAGPGESAGQAVALYLDVRDALCTSLTLSSFQDTLFLAPLPLYEREKGGFYGPRHLLPRERTRSVFSRCTISGSVDFIFGGGDALFDECTIISRASGYVTAPSGEKDWTGFVFRSSLFASSGAEDGSVYLMRPWRPEGKASFAGCSFSPHISKELRTRWNGEPDDATFALSSCRWTDGTAVADESADEVSRALLTFL